MDKQARVNKALRAAGDDFIQATRLAARDCRAAERTFKRGLRRFKIASRAYAEVQPRWDRPTYSEHLNRAHGRATVWLEDAQTELRARRCRIR